MSALINGYSGYQQIVSRDVIIVGKSANGKNGEIRTGNIKIICDGKQEMYLVSKNFYLKAYRGEHLALQYQQGIFGLAHNARLTDISGMCQPIE